MKKRTPTWQEIQAMSDEEVREWNKEMAGRAFRAFLGRQVLKWGVIFTATYITKKLFERADNSS